MLCSADDDRDLGFVATAIAYAEAVVAGDIVAGHWVRKACQRQLDDLVRSAEDPDWPYRFDVAAAGRVCRFIELLPHVKGRWSSPLIVLEPWQVFILTTIFGWVHRVTGMRRFRVVYVDVARKNAKSTLTAGVGLYMLALDGEAGAECYSAATTRDQAKIVLSVAQVMARRTKEFRDRWGVEVNAHNISVLAAAAKFEALSTEGRNQDGLNVHFASVDELHAHKTRQIYDALEQGMGARDQPLLWCITTAGFDRSGVCYEVRGDVLKILDGVAQDDQIFGIVFSLDDGDDWRDPAVWIKANPNLGVSVDAADMARACRRAVRSAASQNVFLTKRCNLWVNADVAWMNMDQWTAVARPDLSLDDFEGEECVVALDLASKVDIAAKVVGFERDGRVYAFGTWYLPEAAIESEANASYDGWVRDGWIVATRGSRTDYEKIREDIVADSRRFIVREVVFDPYQAQQLIAALIDEGLECVELRPTVLNFSEPMKDLDARVRSGTFHHNGDPVFEWQISNVVCHTDAKDNIYPRKERAENKIDGAVATIMLLNRLNAGETESKTFTYERQEEDAAAHA